MNKSRLHQIPKRRKLSRKKIISLINMRGSAQEMDLTYADISGVDLGLTIEAMPALDGAVFGIYGDIRSRVLAENTFFQGASLRGTKFTYGILRGARFYKADLTESDLRFADLTNANMVETCLAGASLFRAQFVGTRLSGTNLSGADIYLATFSGETDLSKENFGEYLVQENEQEYRKFIGRAVLPTSLNPMGDHLRDRYFKAAHIYQGLQVHFQSIGKFADAVWAYRKEKRMRKNWKSQQSNDLWKAGQRKKSLELRFSWLGDWVVEILCDYGESVWRVVGWMAVLLFIVGPLLLSGLGGIEWSEQLTREFSALPSALDKVWFWYSHYLLYTLDTFTTASFSGLQPKNDAVKLASGFFAIAGIFLAGLLGFVAGNRIRRS